MKNQIKDKALADKKNRCLSRNITNRDINISNDLL
jgi:hypothetical protein